MIRIKAKIRLYDSEGRKTPFSSGYRPLFNFIKETKTSGQICLIDRKEFYPGDEGVVEITFLEKEYLGKSFGEGTTFTFDEGQKALGEGEVMDLIEIS